MSTLWNTYAFYILYADIDGFVPQDHPLEQADLTLMDRWILSRLHSVIKEVDEGLSNYRIPESAAALQGLVDDLSNWYVRRGRARFWGKGMEGDKEAAFATLSHVLKTITLLLAPFAPFMAEEMYQNMVRSVDRQAPESVHLCDFPIYDESWIDIEMERQMTELLKVIQLGRACRNLANLKVRQPLSELLIRGARFDEPYVLLAKDELNVKALRFTEDASAFTGYRLKPQLRVLGPKYGKLLGEISAALAQVDGTQAVSAFERGEEITLKVKGGEISLGRDDVLIEATQREGLVAQEDRDLMVALSTVLTRELIQEGYAREVISKLQTMRKEAGFEVTDRIQVHCLCDQDLREALETWRAMIEQVVLATSFDFDQAPEGFISQSWEINGKKALLAISKT